MLEPPGEEEEEEEEEFNFGETGQQNKSGRMIINSCCGSFSI